MGALAPCLGKLVTARLLTEAERKRVDKYLRLLAKDHDGSAHERQVKAVEDHLESVRAERASILEQAGVEVRNENPSQELVSNENPPAVTKTEEAKPPTIAEGLAIAEKIKAEEPEAPRPSTAPRTESKEQAPSAPPDNTSDSDDDLIERLMAQIQDDEPLTDEERENLDWFHAMTDVHEELNDDLPTNDELMALKKAHDLEIPGGYTIGDPEIANPGTTEAERKAFDVIRDLYGDTILTKQEAENWQNLGREQAKSDPEGVERQVREAYANGVSDLGSVGTRAAIHLSAQKMRNALLSGDPAEFRRAATFEVARLGTRTEAARELAAGRDMTMTREERFQQFLQEALMQPIRIEEKLKLENLPKAAEKSRQIEALEKQIAEIQTQLKTAEGERKKALQESLRNKAVQRDAKRKGQTREDAAAELAKKQRDEISKALKREGLTIADLLDGRVSYRIKFGRLVTEAEGRRDAQREKAIDLIVHGWPTAQVARATKMTSEQVSKLRNELRGSEALVESIASMLQRGLDITSLDVGLSAPPADAANAMSREDAMKRAREIVQQLVPSEADSDRSKWKKVKRKVPVKRGDQSPDAILNRAIESLENPKTKKASDNALRDLIRLHRTKDGVKGFPEKARALGGDPELVQKVHALIENERARKVKPITEVDLDVEYVPFDLSDKAQAYRVMRVVNERVKGAFDMVTEFWINSILSGPMTQAVNIIGNAGSMVWDMTFQRAAETVVGNAMGAAGVKDVPSWGEFPHMVKGIMPGVASGLKLAAESWSSEKDLYEQTYLNTPETAEEEYDKTGPTGAIPGKVGRTIRIPGRLLRFADSFFKGVIGQIEVGAQAYRIGRSRGLEGEVLQEFIKLESQTPGSLSWTRAVEKAKELTFQDESVATIMAEWITRSPGKASKALEAQALKSARGGDQRSARTFIRAAKAATFVQNVLKFIFPFVRTPTNILRMGLRKSPLGTAPLAWNLLRGLTSSVRGDGFLNKYPATLLAKHLGEQALAWGGMMLLAGMVEGDDDDKDKKWLLVGGRPYSQGSGTAEADQAKRLYGGTYMLVHRDAKGQIDYRLPFSRYEPFATALGSMVDAMRTLKMHRKHPNEGKSGAVAQAIVSNILGQAEDKTFLRGFGDAARAFEDLRTDGAGRALSSQAESILSGFVPNIIRQPLRNLDDYERNYKQSDKVKIGPLEFNKHSWWPDGTYANRMVDLYGRDVEKSQNKLLRIFIPTPNKVNPEMSDDLLEAWNQAHPQHISGRENARESRYLPQRPDSDSYTVGKDKNKRPMTREEMRKFDIRAGENLRRSEANLTPQRAKDASFADVNALKSNISAARRSAKAGVATPTTPTPPAYTVSGLPNTSGMSAMDRIRAIQKSNARR